MKSKTDYERPYKALQLVDDDNLFHWAAINIQTLSNFFQSNPNDYRLEQEAEVNLKALHTFLEDVPNISTIQIGLCGFITYLQASKRSRHIEHLFMAKDYVSEIIAFAFYHFSANPILSAKCLYECMTIYPKRCPAFLTICCKCIAQLSVLGPNSGQSGQKQVKSWKNDYDKYLKISRILVDQIYLDINEPLSPESITDETNLEAEIGEEIPVNDYVTIFCNCCTILRYMFNVKLDLPVPIAYEKTFDVIAKVVTVTHQQYAAIHNHKKQLINSLPTMFEICIHLFDALITCIYRSLENLFNFFDRNLRMDGDILQKLIRWIIHETSIRLPSKTQTDHLSTPNHAISRAALDCVQSLIYAYGDRLPSDQYQLLQNHYVNTLSDYQAHCADQTRKKPYDDVTCRVSLYVIIEILLQEERYDCPTILAIVKNLIKEGLHDSCGKVRKAVHKLRSSRLIALDSTHHLYQPFTFENVEKARYVSATLPITTKTIDHSHPPLLEHANDIADGSMIQICALPPSNHDQSQLHSYPVFSSSSVTYKTPETFSLISNHHQLTDHHQTRIPTSSSSNYNSDITVTTLNNTTNDNNNNKINLLDNSQQRPIIKNQQSTCDTTNDMRILPQEYGCNISTMENNQTLQRDRDFTVMDNSVKRQKISDTRTLKSIKTEDDEDFAENIFSDDENDVDQTIDLDGIEKISDHIEDTVNDEDEEEDWDDIVDKEAYEDNEGSGDEESAEEIEDDEGTESTEEISNTMEIRPKPMNGNVGIDKLPLFYEKRWKTDGKSKVMEDEFEDHDERANQYNDDDNNRIFQKKYPHNLTNGLLKMNDGVGSVQGQIEEDELEEEAMDEDDDIAVVSSDSENNPENHYNEQQELHPTLINGDNNLLHPMDTYYIPTTINGTTVSKDVDLATGQFVKSTETTQKTQVTETIIETLLTTTTNITQTFEISASSPTENCTNKSINVNTSTTEPNSPSSVDTAVKDALVATVLLVEDFYGEK
ncbi:unnamed protein product [Didymodactylos carnosus]|uniref:Uncharacterized protein n=1 Tax=Didymodactylos carnosus TaxID=1234261 RepID=A0A813QLT2_9BILA|nr:unnamed protein product [Didymodactylos carnosus]CAF0922249.1 unnamed protein product [Didymodactylos carnosus]CAF3551609.1 unnamed protein product [Didymodactylos carnosus]CAF3699582.1 unnamed protein product [Didymodactylos carnosus]